VLMLILHVFLAVSSTGGFKRLPRESTWYPDVGLAVITGAFESWSYSIPWDPGPAYWRRQDSICGVPAAVSSGCDFMVELLRGVELFGRSPSALLNSLSHLCCALLLGRCSLLLHFPVDPQRVFQVRCDSISFWSDH